MKSIRVHADDLDSWLELLERFCDIKIACRGTDLHKQLVETDSLSNKWHDIEVHDTLSIKLSADPDSVEICVQLRTSDVASEQAATAAMVLNHLRYRAEKPPQKNVAEARILLVEQHAQFATVVIDQFLKELTIEVRTSLQDAWSALSDENFDVAMISDKYDDGTGEELITSIKSNNLPVKTIAIAAYDESNSKLTDAGADAVCSKMDFSNIKNVIQELL